MSQYAHPLDLHLKRNALHKEMGIKQGHKIPVDRLKEALSHGSPLERKRANFALNARHWHHGPHGT